MTNEQFLQQFGHFIDAPNGIQKLRELILQLAVQGKLVEQSPNDEQASVILDKHTSNKAKLIREGLLKKKKAMAPVTPEDIQFSFPDNWECDWLGNCSYAITKGATPTTYGHAFQNEGIKFIKVENVKNGRIVESAKMQYISEEAHHSQARSKLEAGDILFSIAGTIGETCVVQKQDLPANTNQALAIIRGTSMCFDASFLKLALDSFVSQAVHSRARGGAMNNVSLGDLTNLLVPVPPLAEQHRIVAKVDELMALCDQLEAERNAREETHQRLIRAVHHPLTEASDTAATQIAWHRIRNNFTDLYTTPESVQALRQTILQLAVQGKLVPQDSKDEPASNLLVRINEEREERKKSERIKFPTTVSCTDEEAPFELPSGWIWARLGQIIKISSGDGLTAKNMADNGSIPVFGGNGINGYHDKHNVNESTLVIGRVGFYCGSVHLTPEQAWITDNAFITDYSKTNIDQKYLYWLLKGTNLKERDSATAQPVISGRKVYPIVVGLPPINEQPRIVVKLEELMALCDLLEANIRNKNDTANRYTEAIVQQIAAA